MSTEQSVLGTPGLRERKKAQMRQQISDIATVMFFDHGYDQVRVADIAARAGVSEKTVYNYFPTKESLFFDQTDRQLAGTVAALADRPAGVSPTRAFVNELKHQLTHLAEHDWEHAKMNIPRFGTLFDETPALRAAWGDHRHQLVSAMAEVLAADLGVGPRDPEPLTIARALASLTELSYDSVGRRVASANSAEELMDLVGADIEQGARLLDAGLASGMTPGATKRRRIRGHGQA